MSSQLASILVHLGNQSLRYRRSSMKKRILFAALAREHGMDRRTRTRLALVEDMYRRAKLKRFFHDMSRNRESTIYDHELRSTGSTDRIGGSGGIVSLARNIAPAQEEERRGRAVGRVNHPSDEAIAQLRRRAMLRRFFHNARTLREAQYRVERDDSEASGAPVFTVGCGLNESHAERRDLGEQPRATLLREIFQAMRATARARSTETLRISSGMPIPSDNVVVVDSPSQSTMATSPPSQIPSVSNGQERLLAMVVPPPPPAAPMMPLHPRQHVHDGEACCRVFDAIIELLPSRWPLDQGEMSQGQTQIEKAVMRCNSLCREFIGSLQGGVQVQNLASSGGSTCTLRLGGDGGTILIVENSLSSTQNLPICNGRVSEVEPGAGLPSSAEMIQIPLERLDSVRCSTCSAGEFTIEIEANTKAETGRNGSGRMRMGIGAELRGVKVFGPFRTDPDSLLLAVVVGLASVKSALDAAADRQYGHFSGSDPEQDPVQRVSETADNNQNRSCTEIQTGSNSNASRATLQCSSPCPTASRILPWQAARICIVALAPTLGFVTAVSIVEVEARRAAIAQGVPNRGKLLISTSDSSSGYNRDIWGTGRDVQYDGAADDV